MCLRLPKQTKNFLCKKSKKQKSYVDGDILLFFDRLLWISDAKLN